MAYKKIVYHEGGTVTTVKGEVPANWIDQEFITVKLLKGGGEVSIARKCVVAIKDITPKPEDSVEGGEL